jgi:hypothetical protein
MKNSNLPLFTAEYTLDTTNVLQLVSPSFGKTINNIHPGQDAISGNSIYPQFRLHFELTKDDPRGGGGGSNVPNDWGAENPDLPTGNTGRDNSNENYPGWHGETVFFRGAEVDFDECFSDCIASCDVEWDGRYNFRGKSTRSKLCAISCRSRCRNLSGVLV